MNLIDFHCDTIGECCNQSKALVRNDLHIDLFRARQAFSRYCQTFAVWIPDELRKESAYAYFQKVYTCFLSEMRQNSDKIDFCRSGKDLACALKMNKAAALLSVEGGAVLGGEIPKIKALHDAGVRMLTLTWNGENELGCGCMCAEGGSLTDFGKACVPELEKHGILIDVSHLNEKGFYDVAALSRTPFLATHSNSRIVDNPWAEKRNLSDEQVRILVQRGGVIGINLCADFLGNNGNTGKEAVYRQTEHFLSLGAEDALCMGCDFDGCTVHPELAGIDRLCVLFEYLLSKNYPEVLVNKIFFENAYAFLIANI